MAPLPVLYQDAHFVAVDKPSGLLVHPSKDAWDGTGTSALTQLRDQLGGAWLYPVHRIDRGTSGVLVFARSSEAAQALAALFRDRQVEKQYVVLVRGYLEPTHGRIERALRRATKASAGCPDDEALPSTTDYRTVATVELPIAAGPHPSVRYSLVRAMPLTGRRHQIRRHFRSLSHPVIGDSTYGDGTHNRLFRTRWGVSRLMLVAEALRFSHPMTSKSLEIRLPALPEEFRRLAQELPWVTAH